MPSLKAASSPRKSPAPSPGDRKHPAQRKRRQPQRLRPLHSQPGTDSSALRNNQPPPLTISLRGRNSVQVDLNTLPKGICLLDDENKLLKALEDLFPIATRMKGFTDNTRWTLSSPVAEVFHTFLSKLLKIIGVESIKIVLKKSTYRFLIKEPVYFDVNCPCQPVYWVAAIEKVSSSLFDLCFYLVVLIYKGGGLSSWNEDTENCIYEGIESNLAHLKTNRHADGTMDKDIEKYQKAFDEYANKGPATKWGERISKTAASKKIWLKAVDAYTPQTPMEKDIYKWLLMGKELVITCKSIHHFISVPQELYNEAGELDEEIPLTPDHNVKFVWRTDDVWFEEFGSTIESFQNDLGALPFYVEKLVEKSQDLKELKTSFPAQLIEWMKMGRKLEERYRKVFADPIKLKKALHKQKYLIDIL